MSGILIFIGCVKSSVGKLPFLEWGPKMEYVYVTVLNICFSNFHFTQPISQELFGLAVLHPSTRCPPTLPPFPRQPCSKTNPFPLIHFQVACDDLCLLDMWTQTCAFFLPVTCSWPAQVSWPSWICYFSDNKQQSGTTPFMFWPWIHRCFSYGLKRAKNITRHFKPLWADTSDVRILSCIPRFWICSLKWTFTLVFDICHLCVPMSSTYKKWYIWEEQSETVTHLRMDWKWVM